MASSLLLSRLKRILAHYRAGGFTWVLKHLFDYGCVHNWVLWLVDIRILGLVGASETKTLQPLTGYTFRFATESDLNAILTSVPDADRNHIDKLFRKFFHAGYRCVIVLFDKHVAGYLWAFTGEYVITADDYRRCNLGVRLPSGAVFIGNAYVVPAHRGHGLYRRMSLYLMRHCPPGACFYASISELNAPSLAVNHKLGFKELATVRFIGVFSRVLLYVREAGSHRWRWFHTRWSDLKFDGARVQAVPQDSPYLPTLNNSSLATTFRWPRAPVRMRQERRKTTAVGRPTLSKSPPKSAQL